MHVSHVQQRFRIIQQVLCAVNTLTSLPVKTLAFYLALKEVWVIVPEIKFDILEDVGLISSLLDEMMEPMLYDVTIIQI
jgi:hypothetical protein